MKKYLNISLIYAVIALAGGVFYREFTKLNGYTGVTALGKVHTHLFILGTVMFLIIALFSKHNNLDNCKLFRVFLWIYNAGVSLTAIMFVVRGIMQVLNVALSTGASASISGVAGIGHILTGIGIIMLIVALKKTADK